MKKTAKKLLCMLLLFCMLLPLVPQWEMGVEAASNISYIADAKGSDFSNNTYVANKLTELFNLLPYSQYPYFTDYGNKSCGNSQCSHCSLKAASTNHPNLKKVGIIDTYTSYSCFAFARYAFYYIWGVAGDGLNYYGNQKGNNMQVYNRIGASSGMPSSVVGSYGSYNSLQDLKNFFAKAAPGDIIQGMSRYNSSQGKYNNHSMIFLSSDDEGIYVLHSNAFRSSTGGVSSSAFGYNRVLVSFITYSSFMSQWGQLVTDFRARQDIYEAILGKGEALCKKHVYNADGEDRCLNCGERFQPVQNPAAAGIYVTGTVAGNFVAPYLTADIKSNNQKGALVEVTASLKNSLGQTWYLRPDGTYCYGSSLTKHANDTSIKLNLTQTPTGELISGKLFNIEGTVSASEKLTSVMGMLTKSDGTVIMSATEKPAATSLLVTKSTINADLKFATLAKGDYRFMLAAVTESGKSAFYQSEFSVVSASKTKPSTPSAPQIASKTYNSITLVTEPGYEYSIGGAYQKSGTFQNLLPLTEYTLYRRLAETDTHYASDRSAGITVKTLAAPAAKPAAPTLAAYTDTTVTLTYHDGLEYSLDGKTWQTSPLFTGLSPHTTYLFVCRVAEGETNAVSEASESLAVLTAKKSQTFVPSAPTAVERTVSSITLASAEGYEYRVNGGAWQKSPVFTGLSLNTEYSFTCRVAESDDTKAGAESPVAKIKTTKNPNTKKATAPTAKSTTANSITLTAVAGYEYSMDGHIWQSSTVFENLKVNTAYNFYCRIAETATHDAGPASDVSVIATKKLAGKDAPAPTVQSYTATSVTLAPVSGMEYRVDGGAWQTGNVFNGLSIGKHTFTQRYAETSTSYAGKESAATVQYTLPQKLTSETLPINQEQKIIGALAEGMKLVTLIDHLDDTNGLSIYRQGKKLTDLSGTVATGDTLKIEDETGKVYCTYTVIVRGDVSGDGYVNITDMLLIKAHIVAQKEQTGVFLSACDLSGDGQVTILDFLQIKAAILGTIELDTAPIE